MQSINQLNEKYEEIEYLYQQLITRGYLKTKLSKELKDEFWAFQGTDSFFRKVRKYVEDSSIDKLNALALKLKEIYNNYLISSPKSISIIECPRINSLQVLQNELQVLINQSASHIFAQKFPHVVTGQNLNATDDNYIPVKLERFDANLRGVSYPALRLWLCRKATFKKRQEFKASDLPEEMQTFLQKNDFPTAETQVRAESIDFKENINYIDFLENFEYLFAFQDIANITSTSVTQTRD